MSLSFIGGFVSGFIFAIILRLLLLAWRRRPRLEIGPVIYGSMSGGGPVFETPQELEAYIRGKKDAATESAQPTGGAQ